MSSWATVSYARMCFQVSCTTQLHIWGSSHKGHVNTFLLRTASQETLNCCILGERDHLDRHVTTSTSATIARCRIDLIETCPGHDIYSCSLKSNVVWTFCKVAGSCEDPRSHPSSSGRFTRDVIPRITL